MALHTQQSLADENNSSKHTNVTHLSNSNLWQNLRAGTADRNFYPAWLELQCSLIDSVNRGAVFSGSDTHGWSTVCVMPSGFQPTQNFVHLIGKVCSEKRGVIVQAQDADQEKVTFSQSGSVILGYPVIEKATVVSVVILELQPRSATSVETAMRQLQWGTSWLTARLLDQRYEAESREKDAHIHLLHNEIFIIEATIQQSDSRSAMLTMSTLLAEKFDCERVSIGFADKQRMRVKAISHTPRFNREQNRIRALEALMDESSDQGEMLLYPNEEHEESKILHAHRKYGLTMGPVSLCTVPLFNVEKMCVGAVVFERSSGRALTDGEITSITNVTGICGAIIQEKRLNERPLSVKILKSWKEWFSRNEATGNVLKRTGIAAFGFLALVMFFVSVDYRVGANITLEGTVQRVAIAPFDGFLNDAMVRAGDIVQADQVLAEIDTRELILERLRWNSQRRQYTLEYHKAIAENKVAQSKIIQEQVNQANAQIALLDEQISRATIRAPLAGVIIRGDLSQTIGIPVERGQILFEVAPLDSYRITLEVHEKSIERIASGQQGEFVVNAMPDQTFAFVVTSVTPVSALKDGQAYFRVEGRLKSSSEKLRPGMQGIGKITIGRKSLIWIWTHEITDVMRLWLWSVIP